MSFVRTNSGLSNFHAFCDVEYMVYTEGGDSAKEGNDDGIWSIDSIFWRSAFRRFLPDVKIKIKSLGSKECVKPYAEKILSNSISNSIAVFDRDYDIYRGELMNHERIFYTHGYSWENDVCRPEMVISILGGIHPNGKIPDQKIVEIKSRYANFLRSIGRVVFVDLLCGMVKIQGVDREKFWALIDTSNSQDYKVKRDKFKKLITDIKTRRTAPLRYFGDTRIVSDSDCYGKMVSMFCYSIFCEYYRSITGCKNVPRHFSDKIFAESIFTADLSGVPHVKAHYETMMSRAVA
jgi:hypothetical protein